MGGGRGEERGGRERTMTAQPLSRVNEPWMVGGVVWMFVWVGLGEKYWRMGLGGGVDVFVVSQEREGGVRGETENREGNVLCRGNISPPLISYNYLSWLRTISFFCHRNPASG